MFGSFIDDTTVNEANFDEEIFDNLLLIISTDQISSDHHAHETHSLTKNSLINVQNPQDSMKIPSTAFRSSSQDEVPSDRQQFNVLVEVVNSESAVQQEATQHSYKLKYEQNQKEPTSIVAKAEEEAFPLIEEKTHQKLLDNMGKSREPQRDIVNELEETHALKK